VLGDAASVTISLCPPDPPPEIQKVGQFLRCPTNDGSPEVHADDCAGRDGSAILA